MESHNKTFGIIFIIFGFIGLAVLACMAIIIYAAFLAKADSLDEFAVDYYGVTLFSLLLVVASMPAFLCGLLGITLLRRSFWERVPGRDAPDKHINIVGKVFILLALTCIAFSLFAPFGIMVSDSDGPPTVGPEWLLIYRSLWFSAVIPGTLCFFLGDALKQRSVWSRKTALVASILMLFCVPLGTLFGSYIFWVMQHPETKSHFAAYSPIRSTTAE